MHFCSSSHPSSVSSVYSINSDRKNLWGSLSSLFLWILAAFGKDLFFKNRHLSRIWIFYLDVLWKGDQVIIWVGCYEVICNLIFIIYPWIIRTFCAQISVAVNIFTFIYINIHNATVFIFFFQFLPSYGIVHLAKLNWS
jgi:hypothetical protein